MTITLLLILGKAVREAVIHIILIFKLKKYSHRIFPKSMQEKSRQAQRPEEDKGNDPEVTELWTITEQKQFLDIQHFEEFFSESQRLGPASNTRSHFPYYIDYFSVHTEGNSDCKQITSFSSRGKNNSNITH